MNFGEAAIAVAHGAIVRRPSFVGSWHLRMFHPTDLQPGVCSVPKLRFAEGWPHAVYHYSPQFTADDVLAEDWEIVDPVTVINYQDGEIVQFDEDDNA